MVSYKEEEIVGKIFNKLKKLSPYGKFRKGKKKRLEIKLPYKNDKILNQRSGLFKEEYSKASILSWS